MFVGTPKSMFISNLLTMSRRQVNFGPNFKLDHIIFRLKKYNLFNYLNRKVNIFLLTVLIVSFKTGVTQVSMADR